MFYFFKFTFLFMARSSNSDFSSILIELKSRAKCINGKQSCLGKLLLKQKISLCESYKNKHLACRIMVFRCKILNRSQIFTKLSFSNTVQNQLDSSIKFSLFQIDPHSLFFVIEMVSIKQLMRLKQLACKKTQPGISNWR